MVVDLDTDYQLGMPELRIVPDRARAPTSGVPIEDVATTINALVGGVRVGKYSSGGRRIDVRLRLLAAQRIAPGGPRPAPRADAGRASSSRSPRS